MSTKMKKAPTRKKSPVPTVSSETLAAQTEAFLEAGGKIEQVKPGVSGQQQYTGRKHITLDSSRPRATPPAGNPQAAKPTAENSQVANPPAENLQTANSPAENPSPANPPAKPE